MRSGEFQLALRDGRPLCGWRWSPDGETRAGLLIVHGMAEHGARYRRFAEACTTQGIEVFAPDLPGHGRSARRDGDLGHFADRDGWDYALHAVHLARGAAAESLRLKPLFVLGHSMGSFLMQHYLVRHGQHLAGAILSGTNGDLGPLRRVGLALISAEALLAGRRAPSKVGDQIGFKAYAREFKPRRTDFDWLSRDEAEVDAYVADPLCGFPCTTALWTDLLEACGGLADPARLKRLPRTLPVLLVAGSRDPVSRGRIGPGILAEAYKRAGLGQVSVRIWPEARHELLNETCRDEVTSELLAWMSAAVQKRGLNAGA